MNTKEFQVILKPLYHKEQECFAIGFVYHEKLKALVKNLPNVLWSAHNKTFYVPKKKLSLHRLYTLLQEKGIYVDYSSVITNKSSKTRTKKKRSPRNISESNKQVVRDYVSYLRGLRLSENTVRVYWKKTFG